jgi:hypothetical protein
VCSWEIDRNYRWQRAQPKKRITTCVHFFHSVHSHKSSHTHTMEEIPRNSRTHTTKGNKMSLPWKLPPRERAWWSLRTNPRGEMLRNSKFHRNVSLLRDWSNIHAIATHQSVYEKFVHSYNYFNMLVLVDIYLKLPCMVKNNIINFKISRYTSRKGYS